MDLIPRGNKTANPAGDASQSQRNAFSSGRLNLSQIKSPSVRPWLIVLVFFIFIASLAAYGGLLVYQQKIKSDIDASRRAYSEILDRQDKTLLKKVVDRGRSAQLLSDLLKSHKHASNLLRALAVATMPQVQWTSFALADIGNKITLSGSAANYTTLAQQLVVFKTDKNWTNADFSSITLGKDGKVGFSAIIGFDPSLSYNK